MNEDIFKGKMKQVRGDMKIWWGKLTDDDLDQVEGNADKLSGALQERYGYSREDAKSEIDKFMDSVADKISGKDDHK
ncbi:MAG: CsbD family protein [Anaerolineales bacterium]|jgi:uncharacterized protein YjbJ (UPF0337 family)|nr:CsbD family protein [Anaerolineales bacterium]